MRRCSTGSVTRQSSTGPALAWIALAYGPKAGRADGTEPHRSRQARLQVPLGRRSQRHPPSRSPLGGQRPRFHALAAAHRRRPAHHRPTRKVRPAAKAASQAARRFGLRLLAPAPCSPISRHHAASRSPRHRLERAVGSTPLDRRAVALLVARLPPSRCALRVAGRPALGAAPPDLRAVPQFPGRVTDAARVQ